MQQVSDRVLIVVASEMEARAVASGLGATPPGRQWVASAVSPRVDLLVTGVGKTNAGAAVVHAVGLRPCGLLISAGIAGALPSNGLPLRAVARIASATFADEGVITPGGFTDVASMGFPPVPGGGVSFDADPLLHDRLGAVVSTSASVATVSTCSGTDQQAIEIAARTGAALEDMETASIALVCARLGIPWCGIRAVSNTTGDRAAQVWDIPGATEALTRVIGPGLRAVAPNAL